MLHIIVSILFVVLHSKDFPKDFFELHLYPYYQYKLQEASNRDEKIKRIKKRREEQDFDLLDMDTFMNRDEFKTIAPGKSVGHQFPVRKKQQSRIYGLVKSEDEPEEEGYSYQNTNVNVQSAVPTIPIFTQNSDNIMSPDDFKEFLRVYGDVNLYATPLKVFDSRKSFSLSRDRRSIERDVILLTEEEGEEEVVLDEKLLDRHRLNLYNEKRRRRLIIGAPLTGLSRKISPEATEVSIKTRTYTLMTTETFERMEGRYVERPDSEAYHNELVDSKIFGVADHGNLCANWLKANVFGNRRFITATEEFHIAKSASLLYSSLASSEHGHQVLHRYVPPTGDPMVSYFTDYGFKSYNVEGLNHYWHDMKTLPNKHIPMSDRIKLLQQIAGSKYLGQSDIKRRFTPGYDSPNTSITTDYPDLSFYEISIDNEREWNRKYRYCLNTTNGLNGTSAITRHFKIYNLNMFTSLEGFGVYVPASSIMDYRFADGGDYFKAHEFLMSHYNMTFNEMAHYRLHSMEKYYTLLKTTSYMMKYFDIDKTIKELNEDASEIEKEELQDALEYYSKKMEEEGVSHSDILFIRGNDPPKKEDVNYYRVPSLLKNETILRLQHRVHVKLGTKEEIIKMTDEINRLHDLVVQVRGERVASIVVANRAKEDRIEHMKDWFRSKRTVQERKWHDDTINRLKDYVEIQDQLNELPDKPQKDDGIFRTTLNELMTMKDEDKPGYRYRQAKTAPEKIDVKNEDNLRFVLKQLKALKETYAMEKPFHTSIFKSEHRTLLEEVQEGIEQLTQTLLRLLNLIEEEEASAINIEDIDENTLGLKSLEEDHGDFMAYSLPMTTYLVRNGQSYTSEKNRSFTGQAFFPKIVEAITGRPRFEHDGIVRDSFLSPAGLIHVCITSFAIYQAAVTMGFISSAVIARARSSVKGILALKSLLLIKMFLEGYMKKGKKQLLPEIISPIISYFEADDEFLHHFLYDSAVFTSGLNRAGATATIYMITRAIVVPSDADRIITNKLLNKEESRGEGTPRKVDGETLYFHPFNDIIVAVVFGPYASRIVSLFQYSFANYANLKYEEYIHFCHFCDNTIVDTDNEYGNILQLLNNNKPLNEKALSNNNRDLILDRLVKFTAELQSNKVLFTSGDVIKEYLERFEVDRTFKSSVKSTDKTKHVYLETIPKNIYSNDDKINIKQYKKETDNLFNRIQSILSDKFAFGSIIKLKYHVKVCGFDDYKTILKHKECGNNPLYLGQNFLPRTNDLDNKVRQHIFITLVLDDLKLLGESATSSIVPQFTRQVDTQREALTDADLSTFYGPNYLSNTNVIVEGSDRFMTEQTDDKNKKIIDERISQIFDMKLNYARFSMDPFTSYTRLRTDKRLPWYAIYEWVRRTIPPPQQLPSYVEDITKVYSLKHPQTDLIPQCVLPKPRHEKMTTQHLPSKILDDDEDEVPLGDSLTQSHFEKRREKPKHGQMSHLVGDQESIDSSKESPDKKEILNQLFCDQMTEKDQSDEDEIQSQVSSFSRHGSNISNADEEVREEWNRRRNEELFETAPFEIYRYSQDFGELIYETYNPFILYSQLSYTVEGHRKRAPSSEFFDRDSPKDNTYTWMYPINWSDVQKSPRMYQLTEAIAHFQKSSVDAVLGHRHGDYGIDRERAKEVLNEIYPPNDNFLLNEILPDDRPHPFALNFSKKMWNGHGVDETFYNIGGFADMRTAMKRVWGEGKLVTSASFTQQTCRIEELL